MQKYKAVGIKYENIHIFYLQTATIAYSDKAPKINIKQIANIKPAIVFLQTHSTF